MKHTNSNKAFSIAKKYIPGGVDSPVRSFRAIGRPPLFIKKAKGAYITDIDGNRFIDYCLSWGVHILGHNHPRIIKALGETIKNGTSFGAPTTLETELAKKITQAMPSIQKVRFVSSGTEAVMSAVRVARAFTGRSVIIKFDGCYHGHADHLLVAGGSGLIEIPHSFSKGVPEEFTRLTVSVPFNDKAALQNAFIKYKGKIAAVLVEPVPANMGVILPQEGFLKFLRQITHDNKSLLIFDEVITGFRLSYGGAQEYFGIKPDLTTLGKIIGGGLPAAAFGGKHEIMMLLAPEGPVYQAGTLSGNPLAMSAGIAALSVLSEKNFHENLWKTAGKFTGELQKITAGRGIKIQAIGPMFSVFFSDGEVRNYDDVKKCDNKKFANFYRALLERGIYLSPAQGETNFISQPHTPAILNQTLEAFKLKS